MTEIVELLKKKMSFEDMREHLAKSGELINRENTTTKHENIFGNKLINNGINVISQFNVGDYTYDLKVEKFPVIIEVDGEIHKDADKTVKDYIRWRYAIKRGFILVRFTNNESHSMYAVEEVKKIIASCTKVPREVHLYPYTFWDWIKDKINGVKRKHG